MDDPDFHTTAMREACWSRNAQVLKRLRLDPARDDPTELLRDSGAHTSGEVVSVLLELGASPNDKPDGGSTVLDSLIARLDWEDVNARLWGGVNYRATLEKTSKTRTAIRQMVELRALWKPDRLAMNDARRALYRTVPEVLFELVHLFTTHGACDDETLHDLLRTPRMQEHLAPVSGTAGPDRHRPEWPTLPDPRARHCAILLRPRSLQPRTPLRGGLGRADGGGRGPLHGVSDVSVQSGNVVAPSGEGGRHRRRDGALLDEMVAQRRQGEFRVDSGAKVKAAVRRPRVVLLDEAQSHEVVGDDAEVPER
jgi:hypothetical protein